MKDIKNIKFLYLVRNIGFALILFSTIYFSGIETQAKEIFTDPIISVRSVYEINNELKEESINETDFNKKEVNEKTWDVEVTDSTKMSVKNEIEENSESNQKKKISVDIINQIRTFYDFALCKVDRLKEEVKCAVGVIKQWSQNMDITENKLIVRLKRNVMKNIIDKSDDSKEKTSIPTNCLDWFIFDAKNGIKENKKEIKAKSRNGSRESFLKGLGNRLTSDIYVNKVLRIHKRLVFFAVKKQKDWITRKESIF